MQVIVGEHKEVKMALDALPYAASEGLYLYLDLNNYPETDMAFSSKEYVYIAYPPLKPSQDKYHFLRLEIKPEIKINPDKLDLNRWKSLKWKRSTKKENAYDFPYRIIWGDGPHIANEKLKKIVRKVAEPLNQYII